MSDKEIIKEIKDKIAEKLGKNLDVCPATAENKQHCDGDCGCRKLESVLAMQFAERIMGQACEMRDSAVLNGIVVEKVEIELDNLVELIRGLRSMAMHSTFKNDEMNQLAGIMRAFMEQAPPEIQPNIKMAAGTKRPFRLLPGDGDAGTGNETVH